MEVGRTHIGAGVLVVAVAVLLSNVLSQFKSDNVIHVKWRLSQLRLAYNRNAALQVHFSAQGDTKEADGRATRELECGASQEPLAAAFQIQLDDTSVDAEVVGCLSSTWFLVSRPIATTNLSREKEYAYNIVHRRNISDHLFQGYFMIPSQVSVAVVGDTGDERGGVLRAISTKRHIFAALIHLGDMSYASNEGTCYDAVQTDRSCAFDCSRGEACRGKGQMSQRVKSKWETFFAQIQPLSSTLPIMTTMGNHDNDLLWFFKFRPPSTRTTTTTSRETFNQQIQGVMQEFSDWNQLKGHAEEKQNAALGEVLKHPLYYSFDLGGIHFISLQTEDNGINAYERSTKTSLRYNAEGKDGRLRQEADIARFQAHFGESSPQYNWLLQDLASIDKTKTPFTVVYTHRPIFHTSSHHPNCGISGDWYGCEMRRLLAPVFQDHKVNVVLAGHSHHYSRTKPLRFHQDGRIEVRGSGAPVYIVAGTGGFRLDGQFEALPHWIAFRTASSHGYGTLGVAEDGQLKWTFFSVDNQLVDQFEMFTG